MSDWFLLQAICQGLPQAIRRCLQHPCLSVSQGVGDRGGRACAKQAVPRRRFEEVSNQVLYQILREEEVPIQGAQEAVQGISGEMWG